MNPKVSDNPGSSAIESQNASSDSLYNLIEKQTFFKGLKVAHLQLLTDSAMEIQFEPGQMIFEEGSPANRFYLMLAGKVVLEAAIKERGIIHIETLGPGDDLGWSWLLPPYYLQLSARAVEPTRTIFFYGTRLREQCEEDHDFGYEIMKRITEVMGRRMRAMQQHLIECLDTGKLFER
jgi:CRP/FNR family transcriptional regulator, cyclic AMP receptor protein